MKVRKEWAGCIAMKAHGSGRKEKGGRIRPFLEVWLPLDNTGAVITRLTVWKRGRRII